jgi:hypothetical protein
MSDLNVTLRSSGQNKVVLNDSGTSLTLSTFKAVSSSLSELRDVNLNNEPDESILIYDNTTQAFALRQVLLIPSDSSGDFIISGGVF